MEVRGIEYFDIVRQTTDIHKGVRSIEYLDTVRQTTDIHMGVRSISMYLGVSRCYVELGKSV